MVLGSGSSVIGASTSPIFAITASGTSIVAEIGADRPIPDSFCILSALNSTPIDRIVSIFSAPRIHVNAKFQSQAWLGFRRSDFNDANSSYIIPIRYPHTRCILGCLRLEPQHGAADRRTSSCRTDPIREAICRSLFAFRMIAYRIIPQLLIGAPTGTKAVAS